MRSPATLKRLIRNFLVLEIGAVALYRMHGRMVPRTLKPLFRELLAIEIEHRERFAELQRDLHGGRNWWGMPLVDIGARLLALIIGLRGTQAILRFERDIERRAVADYTDALHVVEDAVIRTAIQKTLADEFRHGRLTDLLVQFRGDEERHIRELEKVMGNG